MIERVHEAMFHWYRGVGRASPGARALEPLGVVAAVVPAAPERAVANAVLFRTPTELEAAYDEVAAAYADIRANWTVWVQPEGREAATALLSDRGHVLDADPAAMARTLAEPPPRPPADALEDWTADGDMADVGNVNDRSYTFGTDSWSRVLDGLVLDDAHIYVERRGGEPVACLIIVDGEGYSDVQMVAVVPEARGEGIAGKLLRHALADAVERGLETSTLIATRLGRPVYERLGYRDLGTLQMWERRPGPS
jgi:ribosomal protein S18 acetylase RimI-like enzyme